MNQRNLTLAAAALGLLIAIAAVFRIQSKEIAENPPPFEPPPTQPEPQPESDKPSELTFDEALKTITAAELKTYTYKLASEEWEGRMSGKKGNVAAAAWLKDFHEKNGFKTEYQKFDIERLNPGPHNETGDDFTQNIFTWIEGTEFPNEIVVIGAHMDHIGYGPSMSRASGQRKIHPGADDNASGTAVVQEVAQAFSRLPRPKRTILFQHYSAEEMGLIGSRYYCNNPTFPKSDPNISSHIAMVNLDMVGYLGKGYYFTGFYEGDSSPDIGKIIRDLNSKYNFAERITSRGSGGSDHASFYNKRVPVAFLHTGLHAYYHTPDDTPDKINYEGMEQVARYAFELTYRLANDPITPRFNYATFKPMDYIHDHGHPGVPFYRHSYHKDLPEDKWHGHGHGHSHD